MTMRHSRKALAEGHLAYNQLVDALDPLVEGRQWLRATELHVRPDLSIDGAIVMIDDEAQEADDLHISAGRAKEMLDDLRRALVTCDWPPKLELGVPGCASDCATSASSSPAGTH